MRERNLSQLALSQETGIPQSTVSRWMGGAKPDLDGVCRLAKHFGVSVDYLCGMAARPAEISPGRWIIDVDLVAKCRRGEKVKKNQTWAAAIPDRYRIITSGEYQSLRAELGLD